HLSEQTGAPPRVEVPDRAAEESDQPPVAAWRALEVALEVADDRVDADARVAVGDQVGAAAQHRLADVDGHEALERSCGVKRVEQDPRLVRGPGAQLDQRLRAGQSRDLGGTGNQDLA